MSAWQELALAAAACWVGVFWPRYNDNYMIHRMENDERQGCFMVLALPLTYLAIVVALAGPA